jgi:hypothetical protein
VSLTSLRVALVEGLRVQTVKPLHPAPEIRLARLNQQMHVVRHQAKAEEDPVEADDGDREHPHVALVVCVVDEQDSSIDAARPHVVDGAGFFVSHSGHAMKSARPEGFAPGGL